MSNSTNKKAVVHRFDREALAGFVNPRDFRQAEGIELLSRGGNVAFLPYWEVKYVLFVQDFAAGMAPLERRLFANRPRRSGLWLRMTFRDGDELDGLVPNNLLLDGFGFDLTPPDPAAAPRVFVPRAALKEAIILAVIGASARARRMAEREQIELFGTQ